jgi:hypothetical protein
MGMPKETAEKLEKGDGSGNDKRMRTRDRNAANNGYDKRDERAGKDRI